MRRVYWFLWLVLMVGYANASVLYGDSATFKPKPIFGREAKVIAFILDNNHYRKIQFNDSLSSAILDAYILNLDANKSFFLESDIKSFEKYRTILDDETRNESVQPAYDIYTVFRKRFKERMDYVLSALVKQSFSYTEDEYYETNREKEPWCKTAAEMNDLWRRSIKSQALSLKLAGKKDDEISTTLHARYDRFLKSMNQYTTEDVFSLYMNTVTEAYDPHTNYFSPRAADLFKQSMSLSLEGIGARLQTENDYTKIIEILPGGPAEKSTILKVNDRIVGVAQGDGEMVDVIGWRIDDVVKLIKGPKGTKVRLSYLPAESGLNGSAKEISLVRDKIKLEDQRAKKEIIISQKNGRALKLGLISLPSFYMDFEEYQKGNPNYMSTTRDVQNLIQELEKEGIDGIVLDLRNNGGGSLAEAIDLTGLFIKNGPVVQVKNSANKIEIGEDDDPSVLYNGPLVVLTNRFSASASEIFAGAIQDYRRGVVVGESTYGKGTVQTVIDLSRFISEPKEDVGQLKLTFQKFYRVTGSSTQHKGVMPDIKLPTALDPQEFGESANPSALPWDEIRGTLYQKTPVIDSKVINTLNKSYQDRLKNDASLTRFVAETTETRRTLHETKVSLNETVRKKEMEEADKQRNSMDTTTTKLTNKDPKETKGPIDLKTVDDDYLREGFLVLSDLITSKIG